MDVILQGDDRGKWNAASPRKKKDLRKSLVCEAYSVATGKPRPSGTVSAGNAIRINHISFAQPLVTDKFSV